MITPMKKQGFSLIEIMVSLAIFAIVVVVATGALLTTIDATKKAQATQTVLTNLNLALEGMTREIRTGSEYVISDYGGITGSKLSFKDKSNVDVVYTFIQKSGNINGYIRKQKTGITPPIDEQITAPEVDVKSLKFTLIGGASGTQPRVFITLQGVAGTNPKYRTTFEIQTTVSQRKLNR
jgi:prepilin-type N-terminal cleavage/methylation domain-containing protein